MVVRISQGRQDPIRLSGLPEPEQRFQERPNQRPAPVLAGTIPRLRISCGQKVFHLGPLELPTGLKQGVGIRDGEVKPHGLEGLIDGRCQ